MDVRQSRFLNINSDFIKKNIEISKKLFPVEKYFGLVTASANAALAQFDAINEQWTLFEAMTWEVVGESERVKTKRFFGKPHKVIMNHVGGGPISISVLSIGMMQFLVFKSSADFLGNNMVRVIGLNRGSGFYINLMTVGQMFDFLARQPDDERLVAEEHALRERLPQLTGLDKQQIDSMGENELDDTWAIAQLGAVATTKTLNDDSGSLTIERLDWLQTFDAFDASSKNAATGFLSRRRSSGIIITDTTGQN